MKTNENVTHNYAKVGPVYILLEGFREDPARALAEVVACALILTLMFGALFLKEILLWMQGVLG